MIRDGQTEDTKSKLGYFRNTGLSSVVPGVQSTNTPTNLDEDIINFGDAIVSEGNGSTGKRRGAGITSSPRKKRNQLVKEVKHMVDAIVESNSVSSQQNDKCDNDIIEHLRAVVKCGAKEGSDEHYIATKLFIKQEYRAAFRSFETNEGKIAWLRMYEDKKR
ncbi:hypothetical protein GUJ93_ZPchr0008g13424 [Zizania palustris]|uniref:Myb/SANT-like domain-containing protein n=1 Tax=Zizania palustris TaxID=103762 RepID=A0A8J5RG81_ZIZPA|nr:hypothetical protein GUJ93_ZPchr0008g13424 [Zizania palustris]